ncbi:MAG: ArsJ-associated glyceraldehyde-3-phosphate dehydrogenase [Pseudomonadota bacterium]
MPARVAINGFGRMGRLALRAGWDHPDLNFVHVNEIAGDAAAAAHLLQYDSQHGVWGDAVSGQDNQLQINGHTLTYSRNEAIVDTSWPDIDIVLECTGQHRAMHKLQSYLDRGVKKVIVSAPVKDGALNLVVGVNDTLYQPEQHHIITAASCTTNCIAPVVKVVHETFGIKHGSITTIHDVTNTQSVLDQYHKDLRRARAGSLSLIPTSTNSATAIGEIFPELRGKLSGYAVRVPLANASITDCVFEVDRATDSDSVNAALQAAADGPLAGILGFETRPLVSVDYLGDTRSSIVDAATTMVVNDTHVKLLAWYDHEIGYVQRMVELAARVAASL